ncbi:hypothetical protein J5N97_003876 [Dioscorea zingiberensis]|uniref:Protein CHUP1, chloroplastic n=1 Tax=Dioscorea zingiberensis TaxID=325984 RepID=A0A9D5D501_9LILI|nr:hypothetical protein J5N97_003876 [Dioscorea zingiberensis]
MESSKEEEMPSSSSSSNLHRSSGMEAWLVRGKRDMQPLMLKLGLGLALSVAGYLFSQFWPRRRRRRRSSSPAAGVGGLKDEIFASKSGEEEARMFKCTSMATTAVVSLLPDKKSCEDDEGFLLPEFNELVTEEFETTQKEDHSGNSPVNQTLKSSECEDYLALKQEIDDLRNLVNSYKGRERELETQLIEYYGLKEQNAAVGELQNRLKISTVEAKLLSLKIESLQDENKKLREELSDYLRVMNELKAAEAKINMLERTLRSDREVAKEKIAELLKRVTMLQERELEDGGNDPEIEKRLKGLEDEVADLRKVNSLLAQEKSDLEKRLESSQMLYSSSQYTLEEVTEKLNKEIEQLQIDRCADVEELVYLKWINACLRYELRNYQPSPGKTVARDLSKCLSPKSEEKAKQLILEYGNAGIHDTNTSLLDVDSDCCSSSQTSTSECDDTLIDVSLTTKTRLPGKSKFFSKLKKLVLGNENHENKVASVDRSPTSCANSVRRGSVSICSLDDLFRRDSYDSISSCITAEHSDGSQLTWMESHAEEKHQKKAVRVSSDVSNMRRLDLERLRERCKSDVGASYVFNQMTPEDNSSIDSTSLLNHEENEIPEKTKLKKLAKALKSSHGKSKSSRRAASLSFI